MYQKILVPLDESALAECVLPHVKAIAKGCGTGEVVLLEVIEPPPTWAAEGIDLMQCKMSTRERRKHILRKYKLSLAQRDSMSGPKY